MKTLKINFLLPLLAVVLFLSSCVTAPSGLSFPDSTIDIPFYEAGSSETPSVEWSKDRGIFTLEREINGVSINNQTGVVSWNGNLPLNQTAVGVIAENSEGTTSTTLILDQKLSGEFNGSYNFTPATPVTTGDNFTLILGEDGSLTAIDGTTSSVTGSWTLNPGNQIEARYSYDGTTFITLSSTLSYSESQQPIISGTWGNEGVAAPSGAFGVTKTL